MQCPVCGSPGAKVVDRPRRPLLGSLFRRSSPPSRLALCSCSNCKLVFTADERDGKIPDADKAEIEEAREQWERRGFVGPDIVCNGQPGGEWAQVYGFNDRATSWLKDNVRTGRWVKVLPRQEALLVPVEEVWQILSKAPAEDLEVKTNGIPPRPVNEH